MLIFASLSVVRRPSSQTREPVSLRRDRNSSDGDGAFMHSIAFQGLVAGPAGFSVGEEFILIFSIQNYVFILIPRISSVFYIWISECQLKH